MSYDEMELDRIGDRKTAVFFTISDTTPTYNFLAEPDMEKGRSGTFLLIVVFVLIGGAAAWYFKIYLPKKDAPVPEEEYEEPDYSAYADEDDAWDEEDNV